MNISKLNRVSMIGLILSLFVVIFAADSQAQTRKKKRTARPLPVVTMQPQGDPLVISRAADFPDQNSQAVPPPPETIRAIDDPSGRSIEELRARLNAIESSTSKEADQKQKRLLLYLDILTKAEQRAESLRKQVFEMIEKETVTRTRLDSIDLDIRPESIERNVALVGTMRPEELREARRRSLSAEKTNLQTLLADIQRTRSVLEQNLQRADSLVERLRSKLDKDIDDALADDTEHKPE
jgi:hypothetical protein